MVAPPDETTADPYAVIAALRQQLAERSAERDAALAEKAELAQALAERSGEHGERIEHEAATVDIETLKAENGELRTHKRLGSRCCRPWSLPQVTANRCSI